MSTTKKQFHNKLLNLNNRRYLLTKQTQLQGKLIKLYTKELGNNDFISLNYYTSIDEGLLKPCEMPKKKVIDFVLNLRIDFVLNLRVE